MHPADYLELAAMRLFASVELQQAKDVTVPKLSNRIEQELKSFAKKIAWEKVGHRPASAVLPGPHEEQWESYVKAVLVYLDGGKVSSFLSKASVYEPIPLGESKVFLSLRTLLSKLDPETRQDVLHRVAGDENIVIRFSSKGRVLASVELKQADGTVRKGWYVLDHENMHFFGPYNRPEARKVRAIVRMVPDMFLEDGTNVSVVGPVVDLEDLKKYTRGDLKQVDLRNRKIFNSSPKLR